MALAGATAVLARLFFFILPIQGIGSAGSGFTYGIKFLAIACLVGMVSYGAYRKALVMEARVSWMLYIIAGYGIVSLVSLSTNGFEPRDIGLNIATLLAMATGPAIYGAGKLQENREAFVRQCWLAFVAGFCVTLAVSVLYYFCACRWLIPHDFLNRSARLYGAIKSPNALALFAALTLGGSFLAHRLGWLSPSAAALVTGLSSFALLATLSKATFIAFAVAGIAWLYLTRKTPGRLGISRLLLASALAGVVLGGAAVIWKQYGTPVPEGKSPGQHEARVFTPGDNAPPATGRERATASAPRWKSFNQDNPILGILRIRSNIFRTGNRAQVWEAGTEVFLENWATGIGVANWKEALASKGHPDYDSPHNGMLEMAGGLGIAGIALYLLVPVLVWRSARRFPATVRGRLARGAMIAMLLLYLVRELVEVSSIFSYAVNGIAFWSLTGLLLLLSSLPDKSRQTQIP